MNKNIITNWEIEINAIVQTKFSTKTQNFLIQYVSKNNNIPLKGEYVDKESGMILWFQNGFLHREEIDLKTGLTLPAIIENQALAWYQNGLRHREDGYAVENLNNGPQQYWLEGNQLSEEEFNHHPLIVIHKERKQLENNINANQFDNKTIKVKL
jgi:hypothetical protein